MPIIPLVVSSLLTLVALFLSLRHISHHLSNFSHPTFQLHIIRILFMVPLYSLTSYLSLLLLYPRQISLLQLVRDSYEAYVIYNFLILLINFAGGHQTLCRYLEAQPRMPHPWPTYLWFPPLKLGPGFLNAVRASVLQFVFVKPIGAALKIYVIWHSQSLAKAVIVIIVAVVNNMSVSCALYGLVLFYHAAYQLLMPYKPFEKFLSVKAVIFFSFWQGVVLSLAVRLRFLKHVPGFSAQSFADRVQDFLICFEMAVAAVLHYFVFSANEYEAHGVQSSEFPLLCVVDFRDVLSDAKDRFYGDVGFGNELRDSEPIVPGVDMVLGDAGGEEEIEALYQI